MSVLTMFAAGVDLGSWLCRLSMEAVPKAEKKCVKPRNAGLDPENWGSTQESWNLFGLSSLVSQIYFCCVFNCFFLLSIVDGKIAPSVSSVKAEAGMSKCLQTGLCELWAC
jgi:hypothetical protein